MSKTKKLNTNKSIHQSIHQILGWILGLSLALMGLVMVLYGEFAGFAYLAVAVAIIPAFEIPLIYRLLIAITGAFFL